MLSKKPLRFAHSEGHVSLCYDDSGSHLITGGSDGDVRIYNGFEDDDALSHRVGDCVYHVAYKNHRFYASSDDNAVSAFIFKSGEPDGIVTRFTSPVTHFQFSSDGALLAAGSADFTVKTVDVEKGMQTVYTEHEAPILSVALNHNNSLLASSSCDGNVKIWQSGVQKCVHTIPGLAKSNSFFASKSLSRLIWDKEGKLLIVPIEKSLQVFDSRMWKASFSLADDHITDLLSVVAISPCGKLVAGSSRDGKIAIWNLQNQQCHLREKHDKAANISSLIWNPNNSNEMAIADVNGFFGLFEGISIDQKLKSTGTSAAELFGDEDDDAKFMDFADNDFKASVNDDNDDDEGDVLHVTQKKKLVIDDDNSSMGPGSVAGDGDLNYHSKENDDVAKSKPVVKPVIVKGFEPVPQQVPFQPGSTPEHLSHRFMMWNSVGIIQQYNTEEENAITVEFHDSSVHHSLHITNSLNHSIADLTTEAVLLARTADDDGPSRLVCMHFASWDNNKDWNIPMPEDEDILAVAGGTGWVAVATSCRLIRVFSICGIQKDVFTLPGPVVSMAANGNKLLVVYHWGLGVPGDQCEAVKVITVSGKRKEILFNDRLPLSAKSTLSWIGFSAEGTPFALDSIGLLQMLTGGYSKTWVPVADLRKECKGKSDSMFIVGIKENPQQIRAILCKGAKYPPTLPRPTVMLLPFQIPLCELSTEKGQLEESYWRSNLFCSTLALCSDGLSNATETTAQQENMLKLFALACKSERECRAVEICEMMTNQLTIQLAIKYATRLHMLQLAERLNELSRQRALDNETADSDDESNTEHTYHPAPVKSLNRLQRPSVRYPATNENSFSTSKQKDRGPQNQKYNNERISDDENFENDDGDVYEQIEKEQVNSGPMLKISSKSKDSSSSVSLSSSQGNAKNPFKTVQKVSATNKGSVVFDELPPKTSQNSSASARSKIDDVNKTKPSTLKKVTSQKKLFTFPKTSSSNENSSQPIATCDADKSETDKVSAECNEMSSVTKSNFEAATNVHARSAFQIWFEENENDLISEHPDLDDTDLKVLAAREFRQLPSDKKAKYVEQAKEETNKLDSVLEPAQDESKKRKRVLTEDNCPNDSKTPDTKSGNRMTSKLAKFAFSSQ